MKVIEIQDEAGLQPFRGTWTALCESAGKAIFLSWEWITSWWSAYGAPGGLRIAMVLDDHGTLRGIAPLRLKTIRRYGQTAPALCFIGDASQDSDFDYLDFIIEPGYEEPALEALVRHCTERLGDGAVLELNEIPETSPNLPVLRQLARSQNLHWEESDVACATVRLPATWDHYLMMLQPRFRTKVRSVLRTLESNPEVRFHFCENVQDLDNLLPVLFDLHTRRWANEDKPGVFRGERKRRFYHILSRCLLERQWLRLSYLEWKGKILACQFGFVYRGTYSQLQEGYEPAAEHWNLGIGLRAWSIREFLGEGIREYDFLAGVNRHKTDWGGWVKQSKRIRMAPRNRHNLLIRRGPGWEAMARGAARKMLPDKVREFCHGRPAQNPAGDETSHWMRQAAAQCYFRSGFPHLTRYIRDRYQLSIDRNGNEPKVAWTRRQTGSARILYYHRVNDDYDPFFEAISTNAFAEQMRYVAAHYRVLPLGELIRHLEEGTSQESVVGITFDDGYRDNYENAFPILERYCLPATIFLTTGSIDSGEPLWFEQLAEAIKKTTREFLNVEIDIPRRFQLRTQSERLHANKEVFGLLRVVEDSQRRDWLAQIFRQLGPVQTSERRSKMLTWDQVRLMKSRGIDFGGHTVTHPFLSKLAPSEAAWEVSECKRRVEQELQQSVDYFAYPNGREEDFQTATKESLCAAGYRGAMTTIWGVNDRSTDRMELRRGGPWESSTALFASKLDWYQMVNQ